MYLEPGSEKELLAALKYCSENYIQVGFREGVESDRSEDGVKVGHSIDGTELETIW